MTTRRYRLTRDLPMDEPGNFFPRDLMSGEIVYRCDGAYAVTNVDLNIGACVTEDPDGGYPGYQVPLSAVEDQFWQADATEGLPVCEGCKRSLAVNGVHCASCAATAMLTTVLHPGEALGLDGGEDDWDDGDWDDE